MTGKNAREKMGMHSWDRLAECWRPVHQKESCMVGKLAVPTRVASFSFDSDYTNDQLQSTLKSHSREVCACTPSGLSTTLDRRIATTIFSTTSCILPTLCLVVLQKDEPCQLHPPSTTATPSERRYRYNMQATHKIR